MGEVSLVFIYPASNAVFYQLTSTAQVVFALLLPVIKLVEKTLLQQLHPPLGSHQARYRRLQTSRSFNSLFHRVLRAELELDRHQFFVLAGMDVRTACVSLRRAPSHSYWRHHACRADGCETGGAARGLGSVVSASTGRSKRDATTRVISSRLQSLQQIMRADRAITPEKLVVPTTTQTPIRGIPKLWTRHRHGRFSSSTEPSCRSAGPHGRVRPRKAWRPQCCFSARPSHRRAAWTPRLPSVSEPPRPLGWRQTRFCRRRRPRRLPLDSRSSTPRTECALCGICYEFLLLIEYVEVMIPIVYSIYLVVVFHLPNRMYYPQLRDMDETKTA